MRPVASILQVLVLVYTAAGRGAAQDPAPPRQLRGTVLDASSGAPLGNVVIAAIGRPGAFASSAAGGQFALQVPPGPLPMLAAKIGFAPETLAVSPLTGTVAFRLRPAAVTLDSILVAAEPGLSAASARIVREVDVRLRSSETAQELLRLEPGLVVAQHAGGGKAE